MRFSFRRCATTIGFVSVGAICAVAWVTPCSAFRLAAELPEFEGEVDRVAWATDAVQLELSLQDAPSDLDGAEIFAVTEQALNEWNRVACSGIQLALREAAGRPMPDDGKNTIGWVSEGWVHERDTAGATDVVYEEMGSGLWRIAEADIYLNAENFRWLLIPGNVSPSSQRDVLSVLTHELGHVLGLLHPCEAEGADGAPTCTVEREFGDATMYPAYQPGQETLGVDDEAGICALYPVGGNCDGCMPGSLPSVGLACGGTEDCATGLRCKDGLCSGGDGAVGDPCEVSADCQQGACSEGGSCTHRCASDTDCPNPRDECVEGRANVLGCSGLQGGMGASCVDAADCLGNQCVSGSRESQFCTRECGERQPECPELWSCEDVGERQVCLPAVVATSCSAGTMTKPSSAFNVVWLTLLACVLWGRRGLGNKCRTGRCV